MLLFVIRPVVRITRAAATSSIVAASSAGVVPIGGTGGRTSVSAAAGIDRNVLVLVRCGRGCCVLLVDMSGQAASASASGEAAAARAQRWLVLLLLLVVLVVRVWVVLVPSARLLRVRALTRVWLVVLVRMVVHRSRGRMRVRR